MAYLKQFTIIVHKILEQQRTGAVNTWMGIGMEAFSPAMPNLNFASVNSKQHNVKPLQPVSYWQQLFQGSEWNRDIFIHKAFFNSLKEVKRPGNDLQQIQTATASHG